MPEFKDYLSAAVAMLATFSGAWLAFYLEHRRRNAEQESARVGATNRALHTLFTYWNVLEQCRKEVIEPYRGKHDAWFNMAANPSTLAPPVSLDASALGFLLEGADAMVFAGLLLEEQRFREAYGLILQRNQIVLSEAWPRLSAAGFRVGAASTSSQVEAAIGVDVAHKLRVVTDSIVRNVDENLESLVVAHDHLRCAVKRLYPHRKLIQVQFGLAPK